MTRKRSDPSKRRPGTDQKDVLDWETAHHFLEIARAGSFRASADTLGQSVNSVRRRLEKLEQDLGATLLTRHVDGIRLTAEGERVLAAAQAMETASFELLRGRNLDADAFSPEVKLSTTEGLGTFWMVPHLVEYRRRNPGVTINLHCAMSPPDVLRMEADIAVQLFRPMAKDLKLVKLGRLHTLPYASQDYVDRHGLPKTFEELATHQLVWQGADQATPASQYPSQVKVALRHGRGALHTNSSSALFWAVLNGLGLGMMPTYVNAIEHCLVPTDLELRSQHDIWAVYHPDAGRIDRVHKVLDWLIESFSPRRFPWFADKFIHPREFAVDTFKFTAARWELRTGHK